MPAIYPVLLLCCFCVISNSAPWFSRRTPPPPPPGPVIPDALRYDLLKHLASLHLLDNFPELHHRYKGSRFDKFRKRGPPLVVAPVDQLRPSTFDEFDVLDDTDELPLVIRKVPGKSTDSIASSMSVLDNTPVSVEALHLIQRLLKGGIKKKKSNPLLNAKAHHIIITQGPSETVTSIQAPVNACVPTSTPNGIGGSPRSAFPMDNPQSIPNSPPAQVSPAQVAPADAAPMQPAPEFSLPSQPRSQLPESTPTNPNPFRIITTQSQTALGPSNDYATVMQPSMAALTPVLAEIGALLLGIQPTMALADIGHGHGKMGHVGLTQHAIAAPAALALPIAASYGSVLPIAQHEPKPTLASELHNLMVSLQEQREIQRQQIEQQQQLQQEHQNLLQQQRSQLAQMQQQPQQPQAVLPQTPQAALPQSPSAVLPQAVQPDFQGRSGFPSVDQQATPSASTPMDMLQQLLQPNGIAGGGSVVSTSIPQTIITLTTPDDELPTQPTGFRTIKTFRKRKKFLTRKLLPKESFLY